jgi:hypothetical protein
MNDLSLTILHSDSPAIVMKHRNFRFVLTAVAQLISKMPARKILVCGPKNFFALDKSLLPMQLIFFSGVKIVQV